jgi:hypothetical protein
MALGIGPRGYQWIEDNAAYGVPDYLFYDIGMTTTWRIFALDVRYVASDPARTDATAAPRSVSPVWSFR